MRVLPSVYVPLCIFLFVHVCASLCAVLQCSSACACVYLSLCVACAHPDLPPTDGPLPLLLREDQRICGHHVCVSECREDDGSDQGMECVIVTCDPLCVNSTPSPDPHVLNSPFLLSPWVPYSCVLSSSLPLSLYPLTLLCPNLPLPLSPKSPSHPFLCHWVSDPCVLASPVSLTPGP